MAVETGKCKCVADIHLASGEAVLAASCSVGSSTQWDWANIPAQVPIPHIIKLPVPIVGPHTYNII